MTLKELKEVTRYAAAAQVALTHERYSYFEHAVLIGGGRHTLNKEQSILAN